MMQIDGFSEARRITVASLLALAGLFSSLVFAADKPNIVVIWGDDIGRDNLSVWSKGVMGYETPNIDRIAAEGTLFTDAYAEQSCTAGRSSFITGQSPFRTGLSKVGMPGAPQGLSAEDPTLATLLKEQGYATGQFGKNHLGDRNEHLPTVHGFDEFYGNLYHLNAEEEPEQRDYPKDPEFRTKYGPRGVMDCVATAKDDSTVDPRYGRMGKQQCIDTGPLTRKRMETIDDDIAERARDFIKRQHADGKPFFTWVNFTHMHFRTHVKPGSDGQAGIAQSVYHDTMIDHDNAVGSVVDLLDELGIADNTILLYSTDNGPHRNTWPDAGTSPFRNEKNTGWEGAFRIPSFIRWPGKIEANSVSNSIMSHQDWLPTLVAAAGEPQVKEKLLKGYKANGKTYKVHLDGYDFMPYLTGKAQDAPRKEFFYFSDDGDLLALRYKNWKVHFMVQDQAGTLEIWQRKFRDLRLPYLFNLRTDPYEQATITSNTYWDWYIDRAWALYPLNDVVGGFLGTFKDYPPRQKAGSFTVGAALEKLQAPAAK
ncbi:MAG: sulfatase-like hydrolase/transferase [Gammaproteobacteria bacterium]|nr:sulfatase-like hydrolase/transferase [Gammaproteobacteria bacterium]